MLAKNGIFRLKSNIIGISYQDHLKDAKHHKKRMQNITKRFYSPVEALKAVLYDEVGLDNTAQQDNMGPPELRGDMVHMHFTGQDMDAVLCSDISWNV